MPDTRPWINNFHCTDARRSPGVGRREKTLPSGRGAASGGDYGTAGGWLQAYRTAGVRVVQVLSNPKGVRHEQHRFSWHSAEDITVADAWSYRRYVGCTTRGLCYTSAICTTCRHTQDITLITAADS